MSLRILHHLPSNFLTSHPKSLKEQFSDGTLIYLPGEQTRPLFLSCLLHGNETSSFYAVMKLLHKLHRLPRSLMIFLGNVTAASQGLRQMPHGPDFNRIWSGGNTAAERMATEVIDFAKMNQVWASVDMHNNTGDNPYYACINKRDSGTLALASLFSQKILFFEEPRQAQSIAFSKFCTSVTLECGKIGDAEGVTQLTNYLEKLLTLRSLDEVLLNCDNVSVLQTVARILIADDLEVDFNFDASSSSHLSFLPELEKFNFQQIAKGTALAKLKKCLKAPCHLQVMDNSGRDVTEKYFSPELDTLSVKHDFMPAMLTKNIRVAKDDCLAYILEKLK